jgi:dihydrofolate synthase/folylpolyglutamate synthase
LPAPPASASLNEWLAYLEALHPATIDLGLERVVAVRDRLDMRAPFPIITVGGTNGKGSTQRGCWKALPALRRLSHGPLHFAPSAAL